MVLRHHNQGKSTANIFGEGPKTQGAGSMAVDQAAQPSNTPAATAGTATTAATARSKQHPVTYTGLSELKIVFREEHKAPELQSDATAGQRQASAATANGE